VRKMSEGQTGNMNIPRSLLNSAYVSSFGLMDEGTAYYNPNMKSDMRVELNKTRDINMKALTTTDGGAGTAGYALVPVYVDSRIVDQSRKFTPWTELVPRVSNMGTTADYNIITAKGAAVTAAEDAALTDVDDTEDRASTSIKYLYSVGRVTGQMQAAMPSYMIEGLAPQGTGVYNQTFNSPAAPNAQQYEVLKRGRALKEKEESLIWTGDASTTATEFSGIVELQDTTNQLDKSSAALVWADIETAVQYAYDDSGRPNIAGCDSSTLGDLRRIMIDTYRVSPSEMGTEIAFGIKSKITIETMVGATPVIPSQYLTNTTGAKQLFFLDMDYIEMRVLQDMTYERLAKTNDSEKFMLKMYEAFIMRSTAFNSFIDNIA